MAAFWTAIGFVFSRKILGLKFLLFELNIMQKQKNFIAIDVKTEASMEFDLLCFMVWKWQFLLHLLT